MTGTATKQKVSIVERLQQPGVLVVDGATGSLLQEWGLEMGMAPEVWVMEQPDKIRALHRGYIEAGAELVLTCTFGGTRFRLQHHSLGHRVMEVNRRAAELARAEAGDTIYVAGDIGPTGLLFEPMGELTHDAAVEAFAEQARGLAAGGVDLFYIETMSDLQEVHAAIEGIRRVSDLPIFATMTFDMNGRTMMGTKPEDAAKSIIEWGATAVGGNCGRGPDEMEGVIAAMHQAFPHMPIIAKPNAGLPQLDGDRVHYDADPAEMADYARKFVGLGAKVVGGCCGSTPAHLAAIVKAVKG